MKKYTLALLCMVVISFLPSYVFSMELTYKEYRKGCKKINEDRDEGLEQLISRVTEANGLEKIKQTEDKLEKYAQKYKEKKERALWRFQYAHRISGPDWKRCTDSAYMLFKEEHDIFLPDGKWDTNMPDHFATMLKNQLQQVGFRPEYMHVSLTDENGFTVTSPVVKVNCKNGAPFEAIITGSGKICMHPMFLERFSLEKKEAFAMLLATIAGRGGIGFNWITHYFKIDATQEERDAFNKIEIVGSVIAVALKNQRNAYLMKNLFIQLQQSEFSLKSYKDLSTIESLFRALEWLKTYSGSDVAEKNVMDII